MNIASYSDLQSRIRSWLGNNSSEGYATAIVTAIGLAENDMNYGFLEMDGRSSCRGLRVPEMVKRISFAFDEKYETLPADFLEARAVYAVNTSTGVEQPLSAVQEDRIALAERCRGLPRHYCLTGGQIRLAPRPSGSTMLRMVYYGKVPPLSDAESCTAVLLGYPGIYLYGSLAHMEGWLEDDPRMPTWKTLFHSQLKAANAASAFRGGANVAR